MIWRIGWESVICPSLTRLPTTYYSQRVRGSSLYWRSRWAELYSWINHHVKEGNGMPNFFITLSCAKYFWPDVLCLLMRDLKSLVMPML
jgi:hypothetical protein